MTVTYGPRIYFTADGDLQGEGKGTIVGVQNTPSDAYFIPHNPPSSLQDFDNGMRYWWSDAAKDWVLHENARPDHVNPDHWAWDWSERYEVDPSDPMRNSWVLKPDAQPVEPPQEG